MKKPTGHVVHRGTVDGIEFVVIATLKSTNRKTGDMIQLWFLETNKSPVESVKTGSDANGVCKGCKFASGNGCYVNVGQAPLGIWKAFKNGAYPELSPKDYGKVFGDRKVRFGAYGNPSLLPLAKVKAIAEASEGWTGYFHDWHQMPKALALKYGQYFMASTETESSRICADEIGLRYFHVSGERPEGIRECLAETHDLACEDCLLCVGLAKPNQRSIWINPHGSKANKAKAVARGVGA